MNGDIFQRTSGKNFLEIPERASPRKKRGKLREVEQVPSSRMSIASKNTQTAGNSFSS
jgi:hypothetical protein